MDAFNGKIVREPAGTEIMRIQQSGIPFRVPLMLPIVNPLVEKRMLFKMQFRISNVSVEEVIQGVLFANNYSFMDIKKECYSRQNRTRYILFNPFTREFDKEGKRLGVIGSSVGRSFAALMVAALGLIEWELSLDPGHSEHKASVNVKVTNRLFGGHFKIHARREGNSVLFEDDWTPSGGGDMRTSYMAMANIVLMTHPKGFSQVADRIIEEISASRSKATVYTGEIGPPSTEI
jgi:hypothetical protein